MDAEDQTSGLNWLRRKPLYGVTAPVVAIAAGAALIALFWRDASPAGLLAYTFNDPTVSIPVDDAVRADWFVILGYALILAACSIFVATYAFADATRIMARVSMAVAGTAVVADVVENFLLLAGPHRLFAASVAATIKFCMLIASIPVVLACGHVLFRLSTSWVPAGQVNDDNTDKGELGVVDTIEEPGDQTRWVKGFDVPAPAGREGQGDSAVRGLCLSGGGIRSACVAMGAMQALGTYDLDDDPAGRKVLDSFDHIVSVSGGGFSAGAFALALHETKEDQSGAVTTPPPPLLSQRFTGGSMEFDHVRRHSSFIADSPGQLAAALGVLFRNLVVSLVSLFAPAVIVGGLVAVLFSKVPLSAIEIYPAGEATSGRVAGHLWMVGWSLIVVCIVGVIALLVSVVAEVFGTRAIARHIHDAGLRVVQFAAGAGIVLVTICIAIPALMRLCWNLMHQTGLGTTQLPTAVGGLSALFLLQYVATLVAMLWRHKDSWWQRFRSLVGKGGKTGVVTAVPRGIVSLVTTGLSLLFLGATWLLLAGGVAAAGSAIITAGDPHGPLLATVGVALVLIVIAAALDVTSVSLHPFYRRRLASAFAVRRGSATAKPYDYSESTDLHEYATTGPGLPQFVFAAAASVSGTDKPAPGLGAYTYTLSADHIGGPEFGYLSTKSAWRRCPPRLRGDLTVQAAMAISGAAFASSMGRQGRWYQKLLALSGARLGTWLPNPEFIRRVHAADTVDGRDYSIPRRLPSFRGVSYFYREVLGCNHRGARLLQVTDGGHYENLGLVECLRRKSRVIYCIDASGDPPPSLTTLHEAIRLAEYELGVQITLRDSGLRDVVPGSATPSGVEGIDDKLAKRFAASPIIVGDIVYPAAAQLPEGDQKGLLIFAKAVLTDDCPGWLKRYAAGSNIFPHDSTSDQWFSEAQFAAYTELGRVLGKAAHKAEVTQTANRRRRVKRAKRAAESDVRKGPRKVA